MDEILICGRSIAEHDKTLNSNLNLIYPKSGVQTNEDKCFFWQNGIDFLGEIITDEETKTCSEKVNAIKKGKAPSNKRTEMLFDSSELSQLVFSRYLNRDRIVDPLRAVQHSLEAGFIDIKHWMYNIIL